ncbi:YgiW/YdeI family stress tolerance OB fold protein [Ignatzschineria sp. LJL83]
MKKLLLVTTLVLGSSVAFAQFTGDTATGGFTGEKTITTVTDAKTLRDDTKVTLEGNIVKHLGGKQYLFKDATGEIEVEIGRKDWRGVQVGPEDTVIIFGEVDHHRHRPTDIDVDYLMKKEN